MLRGLGEYQDYQEQGRAVAVFRGVRPLMFDEWLAGNKRPGKRSGAAR